jgi:hypothetical protein
MAGSYIDAEDLGFTSTHQKTWRDFFETVPQFNQRQDSTEEQLRDLHAIANRFGFYDAADFLKNYI